MIRPLRSLLLAAAVMSAGVAAPAFADEAMTLTYRGSLAGITVGTITATVSEGAGGYRVDSHVVTQGPLSYLLSWDYRLISYGSLHGGTPVAQRYWSSGQNNRKPRHIQVSWSGSGATVDSADPDPAEKPKRVVPPELRRGTLDPLGALVAGGMRIGASGRCEGPPVAIFDGRARYDVHVVSDARNTLPVSAVAHGAALRCALFHVPVAGFKEGYKARYASRENPAHVWFQTVRPGLPAVPARAEADVQWGHLVIELVDVKPGPNQTAAR